MNTVNWSGMWILTVNNCNNSNISTIDTEYIPADSGGECGVAYNLFHSHSNSLSGIKFNIGDININHRSNGSYADGKKVNVP